MTYSMHKTPAINAAFKRSVLALAISMTAGASYAQVLGVDVGGTLHSAGSAVGTKLDAAGTAMADTTATAKLKTRISTDSTLEGSDISVKTSHGIAVLTGTVPSMAAATAAAKLAASTEGVTSVENHLTVAMTKPQASTSSSTSANNHADAVVSVNANADTDTSLGADVKAAAKSTGKAITDGWITTKVKSELLANTETEGSKIKVSTKRGIVYLSGTAKTAAEKAEAIEEASKIEGVKRVSAVKLKVRADAAVNN